MLKFVWDHDLFLVPIAYNIIFICFVWLRWTKVDFAKHQIILIVPSFCYLVLIVKQERIHVLSFDIREWKTLSLINNNAWWTKECINNHKNYHAHKIIMNFKILSLNANPNLKENKLHKQEQNVCKSCSLNKFNQNMKKYQHNLDGVVALVLT